MHQLGDAAAYQSAPEVPAGSLTLAQLKKILQKLGHCSEATLARIHRFSLILTPRELVALL